MTDSDLPAAGIADARRDVRNALDGLWQGNLTETAIIDLLRAALGALGRDWTPPTPPGVRAMVVGPDTEKDPYHDVRPPQATARIRP